MMNLLAAAADQISKLFPDRGATMLAEAQRPDWAAAMAGVPETVFHLGGESPHPLGERLLARLRDHWASKGDLRGAVAATTALVKVRTGRLGDGHPDTLVEIGALGALYDRGGQTEQAAALLKSVVAGLAVAAGPEDLRLATVSQNLGLHYLRVDDPNNAEQALGRALRIRREKAPKTTGVVAAQLAEIYLRTDRAPKAVPLLQEAHAQMKARFGPTHPRTVSRARVLAAVLTELGDSLAAEPVLRDLHAAAMESGTDEQKAQLAFDLGMALRRVGLTEEGFRYVEDAVARTRRLSGEGGRGPHATLPERLTAWARLTLERKRPDEAEGLFREALEAETRLHGEQSVEVAIRYAELGRFIGERGRHAEAMGWLDPAANLLSGHLGRNHPVTKLAAENLVELLALQAEQAMSMRDRSTARSLKEAATTWLDCIGERHPLATRLMNIRA